ncbi:hypothetical protein DPMN_177491 [Dreissena polymorpha]|uniref:Uncharacterized protein n=1 Tax=Dreissena polymorpha TaxID=45954 RepID=A0A9D4EAE5_DREPO|nr:hypothetical protein DPMN_177491 [Dreissena polymorpha]
MSKQIIISEQSIHFLLLCSSSAEVVKVNIEPFVDVAVEGRVLVTYLLRGETLRYGLGLRSGPILVCTADVQHVVVAQTTISEKLLEKLIK